MHRDTPTKINKYGNCPCCGKSWDGGSIAEHLINLKKEGIMYWAGKPDGVILSIVKDDYGSQYARYSRLKITETQAECPDCKHIFPLPTTTIDESYTKQVIPEMIWNEEITGKVRDYISKRESNIK